VNLNLYTLLHIGHSELHEHAHREHRAKEQLHEISAPDVRRAKHAQVQVEARDERRGCHRLKVKRARSAARGVNQKCKYREQREPVALLTHESSNDSGLNCSSIVFANVTSEKTTAITVQNAMYAMSLFCAITHCT
jgi:hypothetical protein